MSLEMENSKKWINAFLVISALILAYVLVAFFYQISDWFELESKIKNFKIVSQLLAIILSGVAYVGVQKNHKSRNFLNNVYFEMTKVAWPDVNLTWRHTAIVIIAVTIVGFFLGFFDFLSNSLLRLFY